MGHLQMVSMLVWRKWSPGRRPGEDVLGGKCCSLPSCSRAMSWGSTDACSPSRSIAHTNIIHQPGQAGAEQLSFHLRVMEKKNNNNNKTHKKEETKTPFHPLFGCEAKQSKPVCSPWPAPPNPNPYPYLYPILAGDTAGDSVLT